MYTRFIFPCLTVTINDSSAYFIGKLFGRHKLISLSPNKTTEGLIGAAVMTVSIGYLVKIALKSKNNSLTNTISLSL
jgi:CDP-diglyceride synthetase